MLFQGVSKRERPAVRCIITIIIVIMVVRTVEQKQNSPILRTKELQSVSQAHVSMYDNNQYPLCDWNPLNKISILKQMRRCSFSLVCSMPLCHREMYVSCGWKL